VNRDPVQKEISRRNLINGALMGAAAVSSSVVVGSAIAVIDKPGASASAQVSTAGHGDMTMTLASSAQAEGPSPTGPVSNPRPAALEPVAPGNVHDLTLEATEEVLEVAGGVKYQAWTFGGSVPGPVIHLKVGDTLNFTLKNSGKQGHSIDFHAAEIAPNVNYKTILPGESFSFSFTAHRPGVFMYHCGTAPMLHHIANGMYGAIVVDPDPPLPAAKEFVLVQSEVYASKGDGDVWQGDPAKMKAATPDLMAFNGIAFQYKDNPLQVKVGEKVRLYVVNAGPTLFSAFHVVGALFDRVLVDGNPANVLESVQTYTVPPGGGSTFELTLKEPGLYPFVTHNFAYTELGAVGVLQAS
jgi:nitrite reductase (NO-forming)